jgi:hypothetical protein
MEEMEQGDIAHRMHQRRSAETEPIVYEDGDGGEPPSLLYLR